MILVTGDVTARADTIAEILRVSLEHVHRSRGEPGCISHDVAIDPENPLRLLFTERWADAAALKVHFRVKASQVMWKTLQELAADPGAMHIYDASEIKL
ncbi:MAG TPA: putative quinol monooxygenase [Rhizomicrobium sp.]|jgi:quinol monooxygenase YgiN